MSDDALKEYIDNRIKDNHDKLYEYVKYKYEYNHVTIEDQQPLLELSKSTSIASTCNAIRKHMKSNTIDIPKLFLDLANLNFKRPFSIDAVSIEGKNMSVCTVKKEQKDMGIFRVEARSNRIASKATMIETIRLVYPLAFKMILLHTQSSDSKKVESYDKLNNSRDKINDGGQRRIDTIYESLNVIIADVMPEIECGSVRGKKVPKEIIKEGVFREMVRKWDFISASNTIHQKYTKKSLMIDCILSTTGNSDTMNEYEVRLEDGDACIAKLYILSKNRDGCKQATGLKYIELFSPEVFSEICDVISPLYNPFDRSQGNIDLKKEGRSD